MAEEIATDLLMQFVLEGNPVWAESVLAINPDDELMTEFTQDDYKNYSNYFEVLGFDFNMKLEDADTKKRKAAKKAAKGQGQGQGQGGHGGHVPHSGQGNHGNHQGGQAGPEEAGLSFESWRAASGTEYESIIYPFEFGHCSFSRLIDAATPAFFDACCKSKTFSKAILVKRVAMPDMIKPGTAADRKTPQFAYLKVTFKEVLITSLTWDDGEVVKEDCEFICKGLEISYKREYKPGRLLATDHFKWNQNDPRTLSALRSGS